MSDSPTFPVPTKKDVCELVSLRSFNIYPQKSNNSVEEVDMDALMHMTDDDLKAMLIPMPFNCSETQDKFFSCRTAFIDGKFLVMPFARRGVIAYNSKESRWDPVQTKMACIMLKDSHCQIGNVMYCSVDGRIRWYDTEVSSWRLVKGLLELGNFPCGPFCVKLADCRGNLAVFWVKSFPDEGDDQRKMILCAEIALERRTSFEIWGKVLWFDHVLTVPADYQLIKALAATV
ncbi:hypothetical protein ARALYDRAFT_920609 [Arabidopsis lyrata subsp. lyrata]|uniref:FKB95-like N-terminal Kelch domain-containing protein n=2 Tax=Arabidopsis lyrata subsp. lyrata TaxID=81972 RepID=D7MXF8_ARALL|nr:hypothetical protein ARALYDRAFT_920609 [Arabidopsis lyrata subsp. lyrata]